MFDSGRKAVAVIVAHPDDETLWAGGILLCHPVRDSHIVTLCRRSDPDRAPRFARAVRELGASGEMADLDDGPEQMPLDPSDVQSAIHQLLPPRRFGLLITHNPTGEYTRHRRHEETSAAVISLWSAGKIAADELWTFAYEDGGKAYLPRPVETAPLYYQLPESIWQHKYAIVTSIYGFPPDGFEALTTPRAESFWRFTDPSAAQRWLDCGGLPA